MKKLFAKVKKGNLGFYLLLLSFSILPFLGTGLDGYFNRGDLNFPVFIDEFFKDALFLWNDGYMGGQGDLSNFISLWPVYYFLLFFIKLGFSLAIAQRILFILCFFFLSTAVFYFFLNIFKEEFSGKYFKWAGFIAAVFAIYNPYIFNTIIGGQKEYIYSTGAFLFFVVFVLRATGQRENRINYHGYLLGAGFMSTIFMVGNFANIITFGLAVFIFFLFLAIKKRKKIALSLFYLFAIMIFLNAWWILAFLSFVFENNIVSRGIDVISINDIIKITSPKSFINVIRLHYSLLGVMYPNVHGLNEFFLNKFIVVVGVLLFAISLVPIVYKKINKTVLVLYILALLLLSLQRGIYSTPFSFLWDRITLFTFFRNPYKFAQGYSIVFSLLLGAGSFYIMKFLGKKNNNYSKIFFISLMLIIFLNILPGLTGDFYGQLKPLTIPKEYYDIKKVVDLKEEGRILFLPQTRGVVKYSWADVDYSMIPINGRFFKSSALEIKHTSMYNNLSQLYLEKTISSGSLDQVEEGLNRLGTKYIIVKKDLDLEKQPVRIVDFKKKDEYLKLASVKKVYSSEFLDAYENKNYFPMVSFRNKRNVMREVKYKKESPVKYGISSIPKDGERINLLESYSTCWKVYIENEELVSDKRFDLRDIRYLFKKSVATNQGSGLDLDYSNNFSINREQVCNGRNDCDAIHLVIFFRPQAYVYLGLMITGGSLVLLSLFYIVMFFSKNKAWTKRQQ